MMKKQATVILALIFMISASVVGQSSSITYVANEGFIIETSEKKVLVDALFDHMDESWCDSPSDSIVTLMKEAKAPFDDVDLIFISHQHRDHFNAEVVAEHLRNNIQAKVICPLQVEDILRGFVTFEDMRDRVIGISPELYSDKSVVVEDVPIRILRLEHSHYMKEDPNTGVKYNKHKDIENIGFVFELDEKKYFHCGDTNPKNEKEYETFALQDEHLDIAFLERLFYAYGEETIAILNKYIAPEKTFLMHINPQYRPAYMEAFGETESVVVFKDMMEILHLN